MIDLLPREGSHCSEGTVYLKPHRSHNGTRCVYSSFVDDKRNVLVIVCGEDVALFNKSSQLNRKQTQPRCGTHIKARLIPWSGRSLARIGACRLGSLNPAVQTFQLQPVGPISCFYLCTAAQNERHRNMNQRMFKLLVLTSLHLAVLSPTFPF